MDQWVDAEFKRFRKTADEHRMRRVLREEARHCRQHCDGALLMRQSADTIKRLSLELGGNAPLIVFDDSDLDLAVATQFWAWHYKTCHKSSVEFAYDHRNDHTEL